MFTINSVSEQYDTNILILQHPNCLPISLSIKGEVHTIAKTENGKDAHYMEGCPFTFTFNSLERLLYSIFSTEWDSDWIDRLNEGKY